MDLEDDGMCDCFGTTGWHAGRFRDRGVLHCCLCGRPIQDPWHTGPRLRFARTRWFTPEELARTRLLRDGHVALIWVNAVDLETIERAGIAVNRSAPV